MNIENRKLEEIVPYARNPRKNAAAVAKVAASLKEFGWRQPIVVDADGVIIVGHTRLLAAQRLKMAVAPVHVAENLTETQIKAYRLADNRTGEDAEWDEGLLALELDDLKKVDFDLELTGFDPAELAGSSEEPLHQGDAETDIDIDESFHVLAECKEEQEQTRVLALLEQHGVNCRALIT